MYKLNPCPFCGRANQFLKMIGNDHVCFECEDCGARGPTINANPKGWQVAAKIASRMWNKRAK